MRAAALYDIHGNLPALEAVLGEIDRVGVDRLIVGGDVVPGPMPTECLETLAGLEVPVSFLRGNGEVAVLAEMAGADSGYRLSEPVLETIRWTADRLSPAHREILESWPLTQTLEIRELGSVLFCHGTPRDENEIVTRRTSDERLRSVLVGVDASIVVCGHTHMQYDRRVDDLRIVNAGSVGLPFGDPGAHWALLSDVVELHQTVYDLEGAVARVRRTSYPQTDSWSEDVQQPRSAEEMLALFASAEPG